MLPRTRDILKSVSHINLFKQKSLRKKKKAFINNMDCIILEKDVREKYVKQTQ